jgi:23S rRNA pseudouridine1911/1915/1917 synthase
MTEEIITETLVIQSWQLNYRLDSLLRDFYKTSSRTYFQKLIDDGLILVNGKPVKKSYKPVVDDEVEVQFVATKELELTPENIPLDILYEDADILAINKPPGMVVHPGYGNWTHTFVNALLFHCRELEKSDNVRPGIVHRLDKETSGVLLAAKTYAMQKALTSLFSERKIDKQYIAICLGKPEDALTIKAPIGRHPVYRKEMAVLENGGKEATTHIKLLKTNKNLSVVSVLLETGRTHQIRVHMKHIGHPILGDSVYGREGQNLLYKAERQMLHAEQISFLHPFTKCEVVIKAPLPQDMRTIYERIL